VKPSHTTTAQKITRGRVQLILKQPFFGTLSLRLKLIPGTLPTMATDGSRIVYNPAFVDQLKPAELEGTLAHEVLHCALGHQCRRGQRDPELWNVAADFAINPILIGNGFVLPAGALIDPAFNNLSAEEIYARLLQRRSDEHGATKPQQQTNAVGGTDTGPQGTDGTMPSAPKPDPSHQPVPDHVGGRRVRPRGQRRCGLEGSARSGTRRTNTGKQLRRPRTVARSMSGASPPNRRCGRPRRGDTNPPGSKGPLATAANPSRTGERSCVILWPLPRRRITVGRLPIDATSLQACTCPRLNAREWVRS